MSRLCQPLTASILGCMGGIRPRLCTMLHPLLSSLLDLCMRCPMLILPMLCSRSESMLCPVRCTVLHSMVGLPVLHPMRGSMLSLPMWGLGMTSLGLDAWHGS